MPKEVSIKCAHCGIASHSVEDSSAIPGVPGSYVSAGEKAHTDSPGHAAEIMKKESIDDTLRKMGMTPSVVKESVTGSLSDFTHGKDHNA